MKISLVPPRLGCSIEAAPWDVSNLNEVPCGVERPEVFVPWTPMATWTQLCEAALGVKRAGFTPVPHIAARRISSEKEAQLLFSRLRDECAIESVFLVGGDVARPAGHFYSTQDLMRTGILLAFDIRRVGFAGYPEGHPVISHSVLQTSLEDKLGYLRENGLEGFVVSQFCFDSTVIIRWIKQVRASGIRSPIRVGLAGPTNALKLMRLAILCGVGNSLRALRGRVQNMARLTAHYGADDVANEIAAALEDAPEGRDVSLHVFAFGGVKAAFQWRAKLSGDILSDAVNLGGVTSE